MAENPLRGIFTPEVLGVAKAKSIRVIVCGETVYEPPQSICWGSVSVDAYLNNRDGTPDYVVFGLGEGMPQYVCTLYGIFGRLRSFKLRQLFGRAVRVAHDTRPNTVTWTA